MLLSSPWLRSRLVQAVVVLVALLAATPSTACSPPAPLPIYYTLLEGFPANEARDVPLDTAVWLQPRGLQVTGPEAGEFQAFDRVLSITVRDLETGEALPGQPSTWFGGGGVVWKPEAPLRPSRRYEFVAQVQQSIARPAEAEGPTELRHVFTTGTGNAPPLALLGGLSVTLEALEVDRMDCSKGLCSCDKVGREKVPEAQVRVPGIQGGSPFGAYRVEIWVTDKKPYRFDGKDLHLEHDVLWGVWGVNTRGAPAETAFQMPRTQKSQNFDYRPCFTWRVVDTSGHTLEGTPVCLDSAKPEGGLGCAVAGGTALPLLGGLVALLGRRRRRSP